MKAIRSLFVGWLLFLALPVLAGEYVELDPPRPTADPGKVEVIEFFWYGCPHCYRFDPYLRRWLEKKPADVTFRRQPAIFGPHWAPQARAYFTAEALGVVDRIHADFFDAMHKEKKRMADEAALADFFAAHGVDRETFRKTFHSFMVEMKMRQAETMAPEYGITGVPALVVNGRYLITGRTAGSFEDMIRVLDALVAQERRRLAAKP